MKILKHESAKCRIVQKRGYFLSFIIARQRKIKFFGRSIWRTTSWLYTYQAETIEEYQRFFDYEERNGILGNKQQL